MFRLFNFLFNWQYVEYRDSATTFTARVIKCPNGKLRMVTFLKVYDAILNDDGSFDGSTGRWIPLTW